MEFFDSFVIPPSENHVMLLKYILTITLMLFIPYVGMMLGASFISTYFNKKGRLEGNKIYSRFAKDVIEKLTITNSAEFALGTIPVLSALFAYAQLLYGAKTIAIGIMAFSAVIFIMAFTFIYKYRNTFKIESVLNAYRRLASPEMLKTDDKGVKEIETFEENVVSTNSISGTVGKYLLLTAAYLFGGSAALASSPDKWEHVGNILQVIFSWQSLFSFLSMLSIGGIITGAAIIFYFFNWQGGLKDMNDGYAAFVKKFAGGLTLISGVSFPLMLLISYLYLPAIAQSPEVFYYMLITLVITLILCNFVYAMIKNSEVTSGTVVFMLVFLLVLFNIIKDQAAFGNAIHEQTIEATKVAEQLEIEARNKTVQTSGINPQQIYDTKCVACHKFDVKVVGPPYDQTVPKYNGDVQKLAEYIFNPQKIDPNFPPMPNQGLKKKEATAVAQWLISKIGKK
ncbi:MAG: hypothetical protein L0Y77_09035 [Chlorobi bacterium]|nr:hypothetical protein [Chlorobiota bacterium]